MFYAKFLCSTIKSLNQAPITARAFSLSVTAAISTLVPSWTHFSIDTHSIILSLCSSAQSISEAKQAHALAILHGKLDHSSHICWALMLSYAAFHDSLTSRLLFEQSSLKGHSAFLWNTLIRAYTIDGFQFDAFEVYNQMVCNGIRADDHTFPFILKVCADVSANQKGREIHGSIFKLGFDSDVFVGNTLLAFYANSMNLLDAQRVFNEMPERDIVSWNSIITAFSVNGCYSGALRCFFELKLMGGLQPNSVSVVSVLPVCAGLEDEVTASVIHGYVVKAGLDSQVIICNALVDTYGKCGNSKASRKIFDEMLDKNAVSWNAMIACLAHKGLNRDALDMFRSMVAAEVKPDSITFSSLLPTLVELEFFDMGKELHGYSIRTGMESDIFVANSLIDMYAKSGCSREASNVFYKMDARNVVTWNAMVANFAQNRLELDAMGLVRQMQVFGECPNSITFTNVLPACARIGLLPHGKEIHAKSIRMGSASDLFVSNALTDMYVKCGCLTLARKVFELSFRDEVSYNILIVGYSLSSDCLESLHLFLEMRVTGLKHDTVSFVGVLSACANLTAIDKGKEIHGMCVRKQLHSHLFVANSILDLYMKCGRIDLARLVFDGMLCKDVASWNTIILGYGMEGKMDLAIDLFDAMRDNDVEYDSISYIAVLSACSHGGMVEKGRKYFDQMCSQGIEPSQMHYACMVDLLGRAGHLEEASELIRSLPVEPDANIWGALLGACRFSGHIELARWAAEHLFELKPEHCGYYILLSNMYAEAGNWDEANKVRELMRSRGVKKNPGCSWVETRDHVYTFMVGERLEAPASWLWAAESG
ncbi:pentatricopeptide repeat-containing protein At4g14170-like isoform X1 [Macadamia integrifolia]|uniref:pentatricopeptide repeat-containing protein At4g14170-like isoform X1 n=1 Tax=Macadamia integrifolia TaxID=60698 RepID=UPI001C4F4ED9|nr:pentatricopeptide repeat-containing protein At4g14170-like isoform X1 [Macadamia integrifolia]